MMSTDLFLNDCNTLENGELGMVTQEVFDAVKNQFHDVASWAVWVEAGEKAKSHMHDLDVLDPAKNPQLLHVLHTDFVLLGLNISHPIKCKLGNFHIDKPTGPAYKIRYALKGTPLWGSYMTDVIKNFADPMSGNVLSYLRKNPDFERIQIQNLRDELAVIGVKQTVLVAFGQIAYTVLQRNFTSEYRIMQLPHYAEHSSQQVYRDKVIQCLTTNGYM